MFHIFRNNRNEATSIIPIFSTNKSIVYSSLPPTDTNTYWYETDNQGNPIYQFPWLWDSVRIGWKSPLKEYFYNYRNDYDAAVPIGGKRHLINNADWWFYPVDNGNIPDCIWLNDSITSFILINTTSNVGFNGGRSVNLNVERNNLAIKTLECRFGKASNNQLVCHVWGNIKLEYNLFR
jgi:hypothetical protein